MNEYEVMKEALLRADPGGVVAVKEYGDKAEIIIDYGVKTIFLSYENGKLIDIYSY